MIPVSPVRSISGIIEPVRGCVVHSLGIPELSIVPGPILAQMGEMDVNRLFEGYRQFLSHADRENYALLAKGQSPHTLVISCSDSRIIPEEIFGAKAGELFVLRNVGNLCRTDERSVISAVEYAVGHLHVRNAVIVSHGDCGAVKASRDPGHLEEDIRLWLEEEKFNGETMEEAIKFWGIRQLERLNSLAVVKEALGKGQLETGLIYFDLETLRMDRFDGQAWLQIE